MSDKNVIDGDSERLPDEKKQEPQLPAKQDRVQTAQVGQPQAEAEVPVNDGTYIRAGVVFLLLTLGGFSAWAGLAPLTSALISTGEVVVDSYRKSIQHFEGGIVKNIYVRNGDLVSVGDPLIQLDTTQSESERESIRKRLQTAKAELARLQAEQNFSDNISFDQELLDIAATDPDIARVLEQQSQLHKAGVSAFKQEQKALESRVEQIQEQIAGLRRQQPILQQQIDSLQTEQKAFATLFEEGLGDGQRARELDRQVLQKRNELSGNESEIARLQIQATETDLQQAQRKQDYLKQIGERVKQVQSDYFDQQERLRIAQDRLNRATIRAPERGIVVDLQVHTIGSVAPSGQTLLDLVPEKDKFVVEAKVMTQDINDLYKGQLADIRFSAFNQRLTKVIEGEVVHVSADRLLNERDGTPYYLARIRVTEQGYADMNEGMELKPGMPAEVMIRRGERTLFSYLLKPIADGFARSLKEK